MAKQPSLMERFFEQARKIMKQMGDGFEAGNKAEYPYTRQLPAPMPPKRKYPH